MTYEQYWYGDTNLVEAYRKADSLRLKRKNAEMWLQGMYIYDAIGRLSPILRAFPQKGTKAIPYIDKPYEQEDEIDEAEQEELEIQRFKARMYQEEQISKNWGKK